MTAHTYLIYGPLANGATIVLFEGVPTWPDASRWWQLIEHYSVNIFYTAPTAIRSLMRQGEAPVRKHDLSSLKVLGSVGEPINPEAWLWYHDVVGGGRCPIVDTYWQTETGAVLLCPLPGAMNLKPGSATKPFFGVRPALLENDGTVMEGEGKGNLCFADSWPGQARTILGDRERFLKTYFARSPAITSPATAHAATRMAITGSRAVSMTSSTFLVTVSARWKSRRQSPRIHPSQKLRS